LSDIYRGEKMRTLRERATQTPSPEDDVAVDELAAIRADLPRITDESARYRSLHDANRDRVAKLEDLTKRFKEQRYDTAASEFVNSALIATLLTQLIAGSLPVPDVWDAITKQHRRRQLADPTFGSGGFPRGPKGPWGGGASARVPALSSPLDLAHPTRGTAPPGFATAPRRNRRRPLAKS